MKKLRQNKKGFTLVEVIIVLVILAILAAVLIPTLTGYIDKANDRTAIAEARSAVMAAQTLISEYYGMSALDGRAEPTKEQVADLAELTETNITTLTFGKDAGSTGLNNFVSSLVYEKNGKSYTYTKTATDTAGTWSFPSGT